MALTPYIYDSACERPPILAQIQQNTGESWIPAVNRPV